MDPTNPAGYYYHRHSLHSQPPPQFHPHHQRPSHFVTFGISNASTLNFFQNQPNNIANATNNNLQQPTKIPSSSVFIVSNQQQLQMPPGNFVGFHQQAPPQPQIPPQQSIAKFDQARMPPPQIPPQQSIAKFDQAWLPPPQIPPQQTISKFEHAQPMLPLPPQIEQILQQNRRRQKELANQNKTLKTQLQSTRKQLALAKAELVVAANFKNAMELERQKEMENREKLLVNREENVLMQERMVELERKNLEAAKQKEIEDKEKAQKKKADEIQVELERSIEQQRKMHMELVGTKQKLEEAKGVNLTKNQMLSQLEEEKKAQKNSFEARVEELNTKLAEQKAKMEAELAEKQVRMREAADRMQETTNLLLGGFRGEQGVVLREQIEKEIDRQNLLGENSTTATITSGGGSTDQSIPLMPAANSTISTNFNEQNANLLPCTSSSSMESIAGHSTSSAPISIRQPDDFEPEFVEEIQRDWKMPRIKKEGEQRAPASGWPIITIEEEDRPWKLPMKLRRVKKEEMDENVEDQPGPSTSQHSNWRQNIGKRVEESDSDEEDLRPPPKMLLRERKRQINYKEKRPWGLKKGKK